MNRCWIIPKNGQPHDRDVQAPDERELFANGYERFTIERFDDREPAAPNRTAHIYTDKREVGVLEWNFANIQLFGEGGSFRVTRPNGSYVVP